MDTLDIDTASGDVYFEGSLNRLDCDYYRLLDSAPELPREYRGEFMAQYPWAEEEAAALDALVRSKY